MSYIVRKGTRLIHRMTCHQPVSNYGPDLPPGCSHLLQYTQQCFADYADWANKSKTAHGTHGDPHPDLMAAIIPQSPAAPYVEDPSKGWFKGWEWFQRLGATQWGHTARCTRQAACTVHSSITAGLATAVALRAPHKANAARSPLHIRHCTQPAILQKKKTTAKWATKIDQGIAHQWRKGGLTHPAPARESRKFEGDRRDSVGQAPADETTCLTWTYLRSLLCLREQAPMASLSLSHSELLPSTSVNTGNTDVLVRGRGLACHTSATPS